MSGEARALLAAAQEAEERCRRYSKTADLLDRLALMLYISALAVMVASAIVYLLYSLEWRQIVATGLALMIAGYAAYILCDIYDGRATKAARQACELRCILEQKREHAY